MIPVVNTEAKMPKAMFKALSRLETICAVTQREEMSEREIRAWLEEKFNKTLAEQFQPEFLFNSPTA
jgi:hypothetical protein